MRRLRRCAVATFLVLLASATPAIAQAPPSALPTPTPLPGGAPGVTAAAAILVNVSDGDRILFTRNGRAQRAPASLTKVVTALVAVDEYELDDIVVASPLVLQTSGSDLSLEPGMKISVRDLLYALLLKSANDSAMALAAHHPAGYEYFIQAMNEKARSLGAHDSQFRNPHGLDQIGHFSSAHDMAIFAREILRDPVLAPMVDTPEWTMRWKGRDRTFGTHHRLIRTHDNVIGVKTGFTNNAGHCLISALRSPVGTLATVVMGSQDHYRDTLALFEYGKTVQVDQASGGGGIEGFGRLPAPPAAPDVDLPAGALHSQNDPRDDLRWPILMMGLALVCAAMLLSTRRRQQPAAVDVWVAGLLEPKCRKR